MQKFESPTRDPDCFAENLQEFDSLPPSAPIYKLIGPVLMKQDRSEAVLTVNGRVEFIEKEMYVDRALCLFLWSTSL